MKNIIAFLIVTLLTTFLSAENSLDSWSAKEVKTLESPINDMAISTSAIVAVGEDGKIYTSTNNGTSWASKTLVTTKAIEINEVIYSSTTNSFIAVSDGGYVHYSTNDGATWTTSSSFTKDLNSIAYGSGTFVVVGSGGVILRSTNGTTFTAVTSGFTQNLNTVLFANGKFFAFGTSGALLTSSDLGATWTSQTIDSENFVDSIATNNAIYAISSSGLVVKSSDNGATFSSTYPFVDNFSSISYFDSKIVVTSESGKIYYMSELDSVWHQINSAPSKIWSSGKAKGTNLYLTTTNGDIYLTSDLSAFTLFSNNFNKQITALASGSSKVVFTTNTGEVYATKNRGETFFKGTISASSALSGLNAVLQKENLSILVGDGGRIFKSTSDDLNWSEVSETNSTANLYSITELNTTLVAVGDNGRIVFSKDKGASWRKTYSMYSSSALSDSNASWPNHAFYGVAKSNSKIIAVGESGLVAEFNVDTNYSALRSSGVNFDLFGVDSNGSAFVAVGESGKAIYSSDGITWNEVTTGVNSTLYSIAYGADSYFAVGSGGVGLSTSGNAATWKQRNIGSSENLKDVTYDGFGFVATGEDVVAVNSYVANPQNTPPTVYIDANITSGYAPLDVNFTSTAADYNGSISRYEWTFGDGYASSDSNTTHKYSFAGSYQATLTVYDDQNLSASKSIMITVLANPNPTLSAYASMSGGYAPVSIDFNATATSLNGSISYFWDFKDGSTSTSQNVSHVFNTQGTFVVEITATDTSGKSTKKQIPITIFSAQNQSPSLSIAFSATTSGGSVSCGSTAGGCAVPVSVDFNATGSDTDGYVASYYWEFGDGTTSSAQNPNHVYTTAGIYTVKCTVYDDDNYSTSRLTTVIAAKAQETIQSIYVSKTSGSTPLDINVSATLNNPYSNITSYYWDFGDGTRVYNNSNTTHTYRFPSGYAGDSINYVASFHVEYTTSGYVENNTTITLSNTPNNSPSISAFSCTRESNTSLVVSCTVSASDSDGNISKYSIDMNDGNAAVVFNQNTFKYAYKESGVYSIVLTAFDDRNATVKAYEVISVMVDPIKITSFTATKCQDSSCPKSGVSYSFAAYLTKNASSIAHVALDYGDGSSKDIYNIGDNSYATFFHTFSGVGDFVVTLEAVDYNNNHSYAYKNISVEANQPPLVVTNMKNIEGYVPYTVSFEADFYDIDGNVSSYYWNINDEAIYQSRAVEHTFTEAGTYNVTFKAVDNRNDSVVKTVTIVMYAADEISFYKNIEPVLVDEDNSSATKYNKTLTVNFVAAKNDRGAKGDLFLAVQRSSGFYYIDDEGNEYQSFTPYSLESKDVDLDTHEIAIFNNESIRYDRFSAGDDIYVGYKISGGESRFLKVLRLKAEDISIQKYSLVKMSLVKDWNLISVPIDVSLHKNTDSSAAPDATVMNMSKLGESSKIEKIWLYRDDAFEENPDTIESGEGFWLKINSAYSVEFEGYSYYPRSTKTSGWELLGTGETISNPNDFLSAQKVFTYVNGEWVLNPDKVKPGEGFWIYRN